MSSTNGLRKELLKWPPLTRTDATVRERRVRRRLDHLARYRRRMHRHVNTAGEQTIAEAVPDGPAEDHDRPRRVSSLEQRRERLDPHEQISEVLILE
jgi:hypothetical protein